VICGITTHLPVMHHNNYYYTYPPPTPYHAIISNIHYLLLHHHHNLNHKPYDVVTLALTNETLVLLPIFNLLVVRLFSLARYERACKARNYCTPAIPASHMDILTGISMFPPIPPQHSSLHYAVRVKPAGWDRLWALPISSKPISSASIPQVTNVQPSYPISVINKRDACPTAIPRGFTSVCYFAPP
jgi:hypothetical protein